MRQHRAASVVNGGDARVWGPWRKEGAVVDGEGGRVGILQNLGKWIMSAMPGVAECEIKFRLR